jgi:ABC-type phosphate transport system ATPase subunit
VKESIVFSAQLRLGKDSPVYSTPDGLDKHVDRIIKTLELTQEADYLVGSKEAGGLSFEQTKRLSIAVELAASPSVIFLDEVGSASFILRCANGKSTSHLICNLFVTANIRIGRTCSFACDECAAKDGQ